MIHNQTFYIDKVVNFDTKFLFTAGIDYQLDEQRTIVDEAQVIKIWDFQQLISGSDGYNATQPSGLCGGTIWDRTRQVE